MADGLVLRGGSILRRVSFGVTPSTAHKRTLFEMSEPIPIPGAKPEEFADDGNLSPERGPTTQASSVSSSPPEGIKTPILSASNPGSPRLSRHPSFSGSSSYQEDWDAFPPLDRLVSVPPYLAHCPLTSTDRVRPFGQLCPTSTTRKAAKEYLGSNRESTEAA
jgi:hypothetical protein